MFFKDLFPHKIPGPHIKWQ